MLFRSPDGTSTIDDATLDLTAEFRDGGRWRGSVCRSLAMAGITKRVGVEKSERPSRHRGYLTRWRLVSRRKATLMLTALVAAMDARLSTAAELSKSKAPAGATAEASVQQSFPQFGKGSENNG